MTACAGQAAGVTLSPNGDRIAFTDWQYAEISGIASPGLVYEDDLATGQRRLLTVFADFGGLGEVRYSPDGRWLLLDTLRPRLVRVADGATVQIENDLRRHV